MERRIANALDAEELRFDQALLRDAVLGMQRLGLSLYLAGHSLDSPELVLQCTASLLQALSLPASEDAVVALSRRFAAQPYRRVLGPGVLPLLNELKRRGFRLAVVSDWEDDLPDLLASLDVRSFFDCLSVSSLVGATKPDARLFRHALECLNLPAEEVIHVGDYAELDAAGAMAVGMGTVVYDRRGLYGGDCPVADVYVRTFSELESFLLGLEAAAADGS